MTSPYDELMRRVEKYFDLKAHPYVRAKHSDICKDCFLEVDHPIHLEE